MDLSSPQFEWLLLTGIAVAIALPILGAKWGLPALHLAARWLRWILFACVFAYLVRSFEWSHRPDWVHILTGFGIWFFLETCYYWLAIKALSRSDLPLFPSFAENRDGDEWPAEQRCLRIRDWLRQHKYRRLAALKANLIDEIVLRASVYESSDALHRVQILFVPNRKGGATLTFSLTSRNAEGGRVITDNQFLPFGGYYPDDWSVARKPLTGSLPRLVRLHNKRMRKSGFGPVAISDEPLDEINEQQSILESTNLKSGFLVPRSEQEQSGKISIEGRYRLWKEMWFLAYMGRAVSG